MLLFDHTLLSKSMLTVENLFSTVVDEFLPVYPLLDCSNGAFLLLQPSSEGRAYSFIINPVHVQSPSTALKDELLSIKTCVSLWAMIQQCKGQPWRCFIVRNLALQIWGVTLSPSANEIAAVNCWPSLTDSELLIMRPFNIPICSQLLTL